MTTRDDLVPSQARRLRMAGLVGALLCAGLAVVLWFVADVLGTRACVESGYGLGVEGGGSLMTEEGCELTVPTTLGVVSGVLPTLSEPVARAALIAGLAGAIPPSVCLWWATRR